MLLLSTQIPIADRNALHVPVVKRGSTLRISALCRFPLPPHKNEPTQNCLGKKEVLVKKSCFGEKKLFWGKKEVLGKKKKFWGKKKKFWVKKEVLGEKRSFG